VIEKYIAVIRASRSSDDRPRDYDIKVSGAGKGTGKIATVYGYHGGIDAKVTAELFAEALNRRNA
jgi:hypothetical protein